MKIRVLKTLLSLLILSPILEAQTNLQDTRNFFSEYRDNPVPGRSGAPNFYHGSDLYSAAIEGPEYTRLGLEFEAGVLFFLGDREDPSDPSKNIHHGFNTSFGIPLSKRVRPNHYIMIELMAGYDETGIYDGDVTYNGGKKTKEKKEVDSYSLLLKYKYYTPPILRERVFPNLSLGIGNTFSKQSNTLYDKNDYENGVIVPLNNPALNIPYKDWDNSIFTIKGELGIRAKLTKHIGIRTAYHLIYIGDSHDGYPNKDGEIDGDFLHALDLGLSLTF